VDVNTIRVPLKLNDMFSPAEWINLPLRQILPPDFAVLTPMLINALDLPAIFICTHSFMLSNVHSGVPA
jgi:hypothetical protein